MAYRLAELIRARGVKRASITLPPIAGTKAQADDLARIYARATAVWSEAGRGTILAAYSETLAALPAPGTQDSVDDITRAINAASDEVARLILVLTPSFRNYAVRIERFVRERWQGNVLAASGVNLETVIGPNDARDSLGVWTARNVALVRDVSAQTRGRIADIVFRGLQARTPARAVGKAINEAVALGRARSNRIAADQLTKLTSALASERRRQAGVDQWKWRHSGKEHPREEHLARDGNLYTDKTAPEDAPGELPFCGCREQAYIALD